MFTEQVGSCSSFSVFESYVLDQHNYEVCTLYYISRFHDSDPTYGDIYGHTITIYKDQNGDLYSFISELMNQFGYDTRIVKYKAKLNDIDVYKTFVIFREESEWATIIDYTGNEPLYLKSAKKYSSIKDALYHIETFEDERREENFKIVKYGLIEAGEMKFDIVDWFEL